MIFYLNVFAYSGAMNYRHQEVLDYVGHLITS